MNAPKKIWLEIDLDHSGDLDLFFSAKGYGVEFVRADLVEELVKALEGLQEWVNGTAYDKARAALKAFDEEAVDYEPAEPREGSAHLMEK